MTRHYRLGAHTKTDLKVHLIWVPKYRKPVLTGEVAVRVRDLLRQIAAEYDLVTITRLFGRRSPTADHSVGAGDASDVSPSPRWRPAGA